MNQERQRRTKPVPTRMCIVCREKNSKRALTRLVRTGQGVQVDPSGKLDGRGAYLCDRESCWDRALSGDLLNRALRVNLTAEDRERLKQAKPQP
ncbi:MAG: YlxR family protein [Chloroflexi bacterium]|nr:YlxR family protein [Chloroflexota bacterium]